MQTFDEGRQTRQTFDEVENILRCIPLVIT